MDFESVLKDLKEVVQRLEAGDLSLEHALEAFEKGIALSRQGQKILDSAEQQVELLLRDGSRSQLDIELSEERETSA